MGKHKWKPLPVPPTFDSVYAQIKADEDRIKKLQELINDEEQPYKVRWLCFTFTLHQVSALRDEVRKIEFEIELLREDIHIMNHQG